MEGDISQAAMDVATDLATKEAALEARLNSLSMMNVIFNYFSSNAADLAVTGGDVPQDVGATFCVGSDETIEIYVQASP